MHAAQAALDSSAHNIANANTPAFRRQVAVQTEQRDGGVSTAIQQAPSEGVTLETEMVAQIQAKNAYLVNLSVFRAANERAGALLDKKA